MERNQKDKNNFSNKILVLTTKAETIKKKKKKFKLNRNTSARMRTNPNTT